MQNQNHSMKQTFSNIALIVFLVYNVSVLEGQDNMHNSILEPNRTIDGEIKTQEQDEYLLRMDENQTAIIRVERGSFEIGQEVNLLITIISPENQIVDELNTANDASFVIFNSTISGMYKVIVRRWNGAASGSYKIMLDYLKDSFTSDIEQLDNLLSHFYKDTQPGASILIQKNGQPYYKRNFGLSSLNHNVLISDDTKFDIASVSKQIAAFSIAMLASEEKLNLSNSIRKFIPEFPAYGDEIAILHIVLNLSGIKDYEQILALSGYLEENGDNITSERIFNAIMQFEDTYFQPGTEYRYSNSGYFLIAEIVERITGMSYAEWVDENIFGPLDMRDSYIYEGGKTNSQNDSHSYKKDGFYDGIDVPIATYQAQSKNLEIHTVQTSTNDYAKWMNNYRSGIVGGKKTLELIETGIHDDPDSWNWAFGFQKTKYKGINQKFSNGIIQGYRTQSAYFPELDLSILYFSNDGEWRTFYLANKVTDIILGGLIKREEILSSYSSESDQVSKDEIQEEIDYENGIDDYIAGTFFNRAISKNFTVIKIRDKFVLRVFGYAEVELERISPTEFKTSKWYMSKMTFVKGENDQSVSCRVYNSRNNDFVTFDKLKEREW